jgi:hypothetical protein
MYAISCDQVTHSPRQISRSVLQDSLVGIDYSCCIIRATVGPSGKDPTRPLSRAPVKERTLNECVSLTGVFLVRRSIAKVIDVARTVKRSYRAPRLRTNPAIHDACRASGRPMWQLALAAGFTHYPRFSTLICAETIPATDTNIEQLRRIADTVGFPQTQLFLSDETGAEA